MCRMPLPMNVIGARIMWSSSFIEAHCQRVLKHCRLYLHTDFHSKRFYTPRRAILYVPGDDERKIRKALSLKVDCIALDCEDGVASNRKNVARSTIRHFLDKECVSQQFPEWTVRVNSVDSGMCEEDLRVILTGPQKPPTLLLPKVDCIKQLQWFADKLSVIVGDEKNKIKMNLILFIESAKGIMDLPTICQKSIELAEKSCFLPVALIIGSDDLCADLGISRSDDGYEILYARQRLVLIAKAFNFQAVDMVDINYKDLPALEKHSIAGARMGFTGKQVIHPNQVRIVQDAFSPTPEKVQWATDLIAAFNEHQLKGKGAFVYKDSMIDMPLLRQAQHIIQLAKMDKHNLQQ
ncbi:citramalyl-CoA lyase, mitochondrial-like [Schistocerca gregaria]|uniref:citramalyl-CoA lyase, mitochondrial-like n=1 Tax=Schistocerca gregaria TaxID=7010 RepID=UPI00211EDCD8|nr:citramalyl-CoA lyase, mitochondrial-like [Schistocerca gregaria]XP_049857836.1 citramalyl-CoA lyase, mitochondrial-like [Schistocerca gregaria]XP_049857837.1 citramalyl-CoA lyase, mitochondrial-like [Schistocerca gregaria]